MQRKSLEQLLEWKNSSRRKPLVLKGARQVGKTWLMKEFGRINYEKTFYFSFDKEQKLCNIFEKNKEPLRIVERLGTIYNDKIEAGKHLIILDEIQECPAALNSLKYFNEEANEYHIIAAGSLVSQLSKENEKFIYGCIKQGARAREFEEAIEWLVYSGIVLRIYDVAKPEHPLKAFEDFSSFKRKF